MFVWHLAAKTQPAERQQRVAAAVRWYVGLMSQLQMQHQAQVVQNVLQKVGGEQGQEAA